MSPYTYIYMGVRTCVSSGLPTEIRRQRERGTRIFLRLPRGTSMSTGHLYAFYLGRKDKGNGKDTHRDAYLRKDKTKETPAL